MPAELFLTRDGSHSIAIPELNVTYHSLHGAIQESTTVYTEGGLQPLAHLPVVTIFEMGFGTGLNALLSYQMAIKNHQQLRYYAIDLYPLEHSLIPHLNYCSQLERPDLQTFFGKLHTAAWGTEVRLEKEFILAKSINGLFDINDSMVPEIPPIDLIYYDAFAPSAQPELWTVEAFEKMYSLLKPGGILMTYCSKSVVRRAMQAVGFRVEKIPGPWGKREVLRAFRPE